MKTKSLVFTFFLGLLFFVLATPLLAEDIKLTAKDVDTFIKIGNLKQNDKQGLEKIFKQSGRDEDAMEDVLGKIIGIASMIDQGETDVNEMSDSLGVDISKAEYNLVNSRKREVMNALTKMFGR
jgi:hypothetical protein